MPLPRVRSHPKTDGLAGVGQAKWFSPLVQARQLWGVVSPLEPPWGDQDLKTEIKTTEVPILCGEEA